MNRLIITLISLVFWGTSQMAYSAVPYTLFFNGVEATAEDPALLKKINQAIRNYFDTHPYYKLQTQAGFSLADMLVSLNCATMSVDCLSQIGKGIKVDKILISRLVAKSKQLYLGLLDVKAAKFERFCWVSLLAGNPIDRINKVLPKITVSKEPPRIRIISNVAGNLFINGKFIGEVKDNRFVLPLEQVKILVVFPKGKSYQREFVTYPGFFETIHITKKFD